MRDSVSISKVEKRAKMIPKISLGPPCVLAYSHTHVDVHKHAHSHTHMCPYRCTHKIHMSKWKEKKKLNKQRHRGMM